MFCTAQNSIFKNHHTDILCSENHLYGISLVQIIHKTALNATKHLQVDRNKVLKNCPTAPILVSLPHSLPDHSRKPRAQTKQHTVTILCHNNKLTGEMYLLGFQRVYALCALFFLLSSIRLVVFKHRNHTEELILTFL